VKCLLILLYGSDLCPMNSADRHASQYAINKIVYSVLCVKTYKNSEIWVYLGIDSVEHFANRRNRCNNRYRESDNVQGEPKNGTTIHCHNSVKS